MAFLFQPRGIRRWAFLLGEHMAERTNPHSEIIVGARDDASPSFETIKRNALAMGEAVGKSADKAGAALEKVSDNAGQTAKKTSAVLAAISRSMSESQRAIVEMQGYSLKSADGLEEPVEARGRASTGSA